MRPSVSLLIFFVAAIASGAGLAADDEQTPRSQASPGPIVLEPAVTPDEGPVTRLSPTGPNEPWDPSEIGDFTLFDQNGNTVTRDDLLGTPWVASFIFTRCAGACPQLALSLYELRKKLPDVDVRFVTITVDPEYDTVDRMRRYADIYEAEPPEWLFLTGDKEQIYRLARSGFRVAAWENFGADRTPGFEFVHSLSLIHVDADGGILGMYDSRDPQELHVLEQVLLGRRETPPEFRPVPPLSAVQTTSPPEPAPPSTTTISSAQLPDWAQRLPTTNAMLNALATVLLLVGLSAIKAGQVVLHRRTMLTAFGVSIAFLACYLVHKFALHHFTGKYNTRFQGTGIMALAYFGILISHVLLAIAVPFLGITTIYRGLTGQIERHRRIARITFPIWLYVSVTGVIIYWMLYHWS